MPNIKLLLLLNLQIFTPLLSLAEAIEEAEKGHSVDNPLYIKLS